MDKWIGSGVFPHVCHGTYRIHHAGMKFLLQGYSFQQSKDQ
jgi:hypothetical protein